MSDPTWLCLADSGCAVSQYLSAMKVSVSVNLLAGAWIWLHRQSGEVRMRVQGKVGNIVGVVEDGGADLQDGVDKIIAVAEDSIRSTSIRGVGVAAIATTVILFVAFFLNHEYVVKNGWLWFSALALALAGPVAMLITYIRIIVHTKKAVDKTSDLTNTEAGGLRRQKDRKPTEVPTIKDPP